LGKVREVSRREKMGPRDIAEPPRKGLTVDEHIERILAYLFEEMGVTPAPGNPFWEILKETLFIYIEDAIADGIRQWRGEL